MVYFSRLSDALGPAGLARLTVRGQFFAKILVEFLRHGHSLSISPNIFKTFKTMIGPGRSSDVVLCACAKNEEPYIMEWMEHYFKLGFDRIYIYDNNDDPNKLPAYLQRHRYKNFNKVIIYSIPKRKNFQTEVYENFYAKTLFSWVAFFDCDEFLELKQHNNIKEYLATFPPNIHGVLVQWLCYGSDGVKKYEPKPVRERFRHPHLSVNDRHCPNIHIKSILRKTMFEYKFPNPHCAEIPLKHYSTNDYRTPNTAADIGAGDRLYVAQQWPVNYKFAILHHYMIKSEEEFEKRIQSRISSKYSERKRKERKVARQQLETDNITQEISGHAAIPLPPIKQKWKNILLIEPKDLLIYACLKEGKKVTIIKKDLDNLNDYLDCAFYNRVESFDWCQKDKYDHRFFDLVI